MSPDDLAGSLRRDGFPRVSGDEPFTDSRPNAFMTFSPRERG